MRLRLPSVELELVDEGRGPPVLLLHGFPTTHLLWRGVLPALVAAGHRVLAPDLVGHGHLDAPPDAEPAMGAQAGWLLQLLDTLGLPRVAVVAHDVGTAAAQLLVARAPSRVRALVLLDGVHADQWAMEGLASVRAWDPAAADRLFPVLVRTVRTSAASGRLDDALVREVLAPYQGLEGGRRAIRAARALDPSEVLEVQPQLARAGVPAHLLWGEADRFLPAETVGRPLAALLGARLEVLPGGHFLPLERPAEVAAAVLRALGAAPAR